MLGGCVGRVEGIDGCIGDEVISVLVLGVLRWGSVVVGVRRGRELGGVIVWFFELWGGLGGCGVHCCDYGMEWSGIGVVSEMNAMGVHLVWSGFVIMAGIADLKWRREE